MGTSQGPMRLIRPALILAALLCIAAAAPLAAQQAPDSSRVALTVSAQPSAPTTTAPAAQASSERFGRVGVTATRSHASAAAAFEGGSNTIVISTEIGRAHV
jgi:hypothetical protein